MEKESKVPKDIGICVDSSGLLGLLYLNIPREVEGTKEFLALVKDHYTDTYQVEFHENENLDGETFHLHRVDGPLPGEIYYVTDMNLFDEERNIEAYVLYLDYDEYVRFEIVEGNNLPGIKIEHRRWTDYYHVERVISD
jgi:hypothetical protein